MAKIKTISRTAVPVQEGRLEFFTENGQTANYAIRGNVRSVSFNFNIRGELVSIDFPGKSGLDFVSKILSVKKKRMLAKGHLEDSEFISYY